MRKFSLLTTFFFLTINLLNAQYNEFNPDYEWLTIKGEHVYVHYHAEAERTAKVVAKIADEVWDPICSLYEYEPETVHYVIKDIDDYSNGATYFFDNKIEIWASALDFDLRGTHNWLRNVISHEFTHMVQIQAAMKLKRSVPALYFQYLNYEDKRRPDILYGFPNVIVSYPIATLNVPAWFAEGTAQYMRKELGYDDWDTHRDMILRSYVLEDKMLSWNQMQSFGKTSLGNESVYNSGFAFTRFIAQKYGEDKLRKVTKKLGKWNIFTIDAAFKEVIGKDGEELYAEWKEVVKKSYKERATDVLSNMVAGKEIASEGFGNFYPKYNKEDNKVYYISNKSADYFGLTALYAYDIESGKEEKIVDGVRSTFGFIPGTKKIIYAKLSENNPKWVNIHDLYVYDIEEEEETRLTHGLRANTPDVSPDGKRIVFSYQKDGTTNLGLVDINGRNFKRLTLFEDGEQVYNPKFSVNGNTIYFDFIKRNNRDVAKVNIDATGFELVFSTNADERTAFDDNEGNIYYASDKSGIYNIYRFNTKTNKTEQISNVTGGAFMPTVDNKGDIFYAGYTSGGYKIFSLESAKQSEVNDRMSYKWQENPPLNQEIKNGDIAKFDLNYLRNYDDTEIPEYTPQKYSGFFSKMTFFPIVRFDGYNTGNSFIDKVKPGVYFTSSDYLNRFSVFGGITLNKRLERDAFLSFEYRDKLPLLFNIGLKPELKAEIYSVSRKTNSDILFDVDSTGGKFSYADKVKADITYNLFEVDFAAKHKLFYGDNYLEYRLIYSQYSATIGSFIIPNTSSLYPEFEDKYFSGWNNQLKFTHKSIKPGQDSDINPVGRDIELQYNYESNKYNVTGDYTTDDGMLKPNYNHYNLHRLELNYKEHIAVAKGHTLSARFRAATIFGPAVPDFFDYYLGGLIGMKAYPFYAISGNELGWVNLTYRFPLLKNIDTRFAHLYIDKVFMSVYGDFGNAWTGNIPGLNDFKKGAGAELRIKMNSFYLFPTAIFFNASYSFDKVSREVRDETINYGKEWSFYGGILFDFEI